MGLLVVLHALVAHLQVVIIGEQFAHVFVGDSVNFAVLEVDIIIGHSRLVRSVIDVAIEQVFQGLCQKDQDKA